MDEDLKALLETMRQENAAAHAETRQLVGASAAETRQYVDRLVGDLRQEEAAAHEETRRHFDVAAESQRHEIQLIAQGVAMLAERMDRRDTHVDDVTKDLDRRVIRLEVESTRR